MRSLSGDWVVISVLLLVVVAPGLCRAARIRLTPYEREFVTDALKEHKLRREYHPEGKRIGRIILYRIPVYTKRDFFPSFLNYLHVTSKRHVIKRELLFREASLFDWERINETARNLRNLRRIAMALVIPVKSKQKGRVDILVITKDIWSIRLNTDFQLANGKLIYLFMQPTEENLLGLHQTVGLNFLLQLDTVQFGPLYSNPRMAGSRYSFSGSSAIIFNRWSRKVEGGNASISVSRPLYSLRTKWGMSVSSSFSIGISRSYLGSTLRTYDDPDTPDTETIPYLYKRQNYSGSLWYTRSLGYRIKHNFSFGLAYFVTRYKMTGDVPERSRANFAKDLVPIDETLVYPSFEYSTYRAKYTTIQNAATLGLTEDVRLGHSLTLQVFWPSRIWGLDRNFLGVSATLGYTWSIADRHFIAVSLSGSTELESTRAVNTLVQVIVRQISPMLLFGRFIWEVRSDTRWNNERKSRTSLGNDSRLRGFPNGSFVGQNLLLSNLEFRTRGLSLWTLHFGLAAFWDMGDAFDDYRKLRIKHGVGIGLRVLIPQWDRAVLRVDWGFPVYGGGKAFPGIVLVTMRQAF